MQVKYRILSVTVVAVLCALFLFSVSVTAAEKCDPTNCKVICKAGDAGKEKCCKKDDKDCCKRSDGTCDKSCDKDCCKGTDGKCCPAAGDKCCPKSATKASANSDCCFKVGNCCPATKGSSAKKSATYGKV